MKRYLLLTIVNLICLVSFAQFELKQVDSIKYVTPKEHYDSLKTLQKKYTFKERMLSLPDSVKIKRNFKTLPLPVIYSSTEVGLAVGANVQSYWHFRRNLRNQQSSARMTAVYTLYDQYTIKGFWDFSMGEDMWRVRGQANYSHFPLKYFGIGPEKNDEEEIAEFVSQDFMKITSDGMRRLSSTLFVGMQATYTTLLDAFVMEDETFDYSGKTEDFFLDNSPGAEGYSLFGFGPKIVLDSRDNTKYAYTGSYFELSSNFFFGEKEYNYTNVIIDYRKYWTLKEGHHFAAMGYMNMNFGDIPYKEMPGFGQDFNDALSVGRGYYQGRYIDKNLLYAQAEYRFPLFGKFRGVGFAGLGNVTDKMSDFQFDSMKFNFGAGIRIPFDEAGRVYMRADFATAPNEGLAFQLKFSEAF